MNKKLYLLLYISCAIALCLLSCTVKESNFLNKKIIFTESDATYTMYGPVPDYKIDMAKPKVVTYCWSVNNLARLLRETPYLKVNTIINQNPNIEFIFYLDGINHSDIDEVLSIFDHYNVTYPFIFDYDSKLAKANDHISRLWGSLRYQDGIKMISFFCDESNRMYKEIAGVIGTDLSKMYFDPCFVKFKAALKSRKKEPSCSNE